MRPGGSTVVLLGPQEVEGVQAGRVLRELEVKGKRASVALVTAGWQERESEDEALVRALGVATVNLRLDARSDELFAADRELADAYKARQERLRHIQEFYRVRLDHVDDAARAIAVRHVDPELLEQESQVSIALFRQLDNDHLARCAQVHAAFEARWRLAERPSVARHREELLKLIAPASALVIAGGHIGTLLNRLRLFDVLALAAHKPIVAWSAGAMVLTERIACFHDYPPYGTDVAQVLDAGFGLAPGIMVLPDPRRRIRMDDRAGIGRFAQRMAPMTCVAMDFGAKVMVAGGEVVSSTAYRLTTTGDIEPAWLSLDHRDGGPQ